MKINRPVALVTEYPSPWGPVRQHGGGSLNRDSEGKIKRDIREMYKCPVSRYLFPQGPCWGTWRVFACWDFLSENDSIFGFFSWTQRTLRF
jgi:hypothetical protein